MRPLHVLTSLFVRGDMLESTCVHVVLQNQGESMSPSLCVVILLGLQVDRQLARGRSVFHISSHIWHDTRSSHVFKEREWEQLPAEAAWRPESDTREDVCCSVGL